jgi:ABC-type phosphate transport system substrate-binding protein
MARAAIASIAVCFALAPRVSTAGDDGFQVIANADLHLSELDRETLRDIYLEKVTDLDGHVVHPIQLTSKLPAGERFVREVIRKSPAQLKSYWNQQIFSGKGVPPPEADSAAAAITYVVEHPGAISYIPSNVDPGAARVVRLK